MAEQRSFSAGFRCLPHAPPLSARSRVSRSMSSSSTTSPTSKTAAKGLRPSVLGILLPALPLNPDALRRRPHLWPRPHSVPSLAPAPTAPTAYARTPLCHRGPLWVGLADLPPTLDASHRSGTAWSLPSEPGLALFLSEMRRPASPSPARRRT